MTEDEEAELLGFSGKYIDGDLYVSFEDFDRLRLWVRKHLNTIREAKNDEESRLEQHKKDIERLRQDRFLDLDMQGGQV